MKKIITFLVFTISLFIANNLIAQTITDAKQSPTNDVKAEDLKIDMNANSKQGENPEIHNTSPEPTPTPRDYTNPPQSVTPSGDIDSKNKSIDVKVTIPIPPNKELEN